MKQKVLGLAAIATMLTLVFFQFDQDSADEISADESLILLPEVKSALGSVSEIKILSGDKASKVTIVSDDRGWLVQEKSGYQADFETLSELLLEIAEMKVLERKTIRVENHEKLGLADKGESMGVIVRISAGRIHEIMVGQTSQTQGTFVRRPEENQVYLVEQEIDVSMDPIDYLNPVFLSLESSEVEAVVIQTPNSLLKANRDELTKKMVIEDIPEDAELRYDTVADSLARIFINLRFEDVEPYRPEFFNQPSLTTVTTSSGDSKTIMSETIGETFWVHLGQDWQYRVNEFTYNELNKSMQDMLKLENENEE